MKANQIWQAALGELQLQMTKATFDTWVKNTHVVSFEDGTFIIGVHNAFTKDWLENRLLTTVKRTLVGIVGRSVEVKFTVWAKEPPESDEALPLLQTIAPLPESAANGPPTMLNPRYTFDTFVVGSNNRLAHAASLAVAEKPAEAYNPLFIYGGVGLGKTHLLHAVGHMSQRHCGEVLYVSSETFTNDLINSIRNHTTEEFRERYRNIDVLLVDDIQFIAGKESTQEEFFHTFNTLHSANKQIIISSDRAPKAILTLEERLRSRFEWGLIADIQPPDLETRIAILRFKAEQQATPVPDKVIDLIAHRIQSNIRELEGALNRVIAHASLMRCPLTVEVAITALQDFGPAPGSLSVDQIIEDVAQFYSLETKDLLGRRRSKDIVTARQMAMYLAREETNASLPQIGRALGGRDHTTVLHGYGKIHAQVEEDDRLRREMLAIKELLYNHQGSPSQK
ncbi:MAG: chromosomal replication initiator protein DnaA [Anaerolineae bacterium]|nr:chromosomal replication initiator protein DnaA [Anaerolineae bacterium]